MTANETTPGDGQERTGVETERALEVAQSAVAAMLEARAADVSDTSHRVAAALWRGEGPTSEQVSDLRREIDGLRFAVEEHAARLAEGCEPWETDGHHLTTAQLEELTDELGEP